MNADTEAAKRHEGQTLFDIVEEIIRIHSPGGPEGTDQAILQLEDD